MKNRATIVKMEAEINPVVSPGVEKFSSPTAKAEMKTESSNHFKTERFENDEEETKTARVRRGSKKRISRNALTDFYSTLYSQVLSLAK